MEIAEKKKSKIDSLQGYRAFAFFLIFISHADIIATGAIGVSIFIVLSGFLMGISYNSTRIESLPMHFWEKVGFSYGKLKKLLPLHLITFLMMMVVTVITFCSNNDINSKSIIYLITAGVPNAAMLQSWIPVENYYFSFNKVSWYLGVCSFSYFIFPSLARFFEGNYKANKKRIVFFISCLLCLMVLLPLSIGVVVASNDCIKWFTYICPAYRACDFVFGYILGSFIRKTRCFAPYNKHSNFYILFSFIEIAWLLLLAGWVIIYLNCGIPSEIRYDIFWLPISLSGVLIFYVGGGGDI